MQCGHEQRAIKKAVAALAGGLWRKEAGMAGRAMDCQSVGIRDMLGAQGIGRAPDERFERGVEMAFEFAGHAEMH